MHLPKSMLVHICCSVDSHHFLSELRAVLPNTKLLGYFYNPNIHPEEEFDIRLLDVRRSCRLLNIELLVEPYNPAMWLQNSIGLEHYPEKSERCSFCFDFRLQKSAEVAKNLGLDSITTTLLASPMKSTEQLFIQGRIIESQNGVRFFAIDVRSRGGTARQQKLAKDTHLYRQNYCGCIYALKAQRTQSEKEALELICPLSQIRNSEGLFAQRSNALIKRDEHEAENRPYFWTKERINMWQNLHTLVLDSHGMLIPAHLIAHSSCNSRLSTKIELCHENIAYADKEGVKFIALDYFCELTKRSYGNIHELIYNPPILAIELEIRRKLGDSEFGISPILVVATLPKIGETYKITIKTISQEESIERVIQL